MNQPLARMANGIREFGLIAGHYDEVKGLPDYKVHYRKPLALI